MLVVISTKHARILIAEGRPGNVNPVEATLGRARRRLNIADLPEGRSTSAVAFVRLGTIV